MKEKHFFYLNNSHNSLNEPGGVGMEGEENLGKKEERKTETEKKNKTK